MPKLQEEALHVLNLFSLAGHWLTDAGNRILIRMSHIAFHFPGSSYESDLEAVIPPDAGIRFCAVRLPGLCECSSEHDLLASLAGDIMHVVNATWAAHVSWVPLHIPPSHRTMGHELLPKLHPTTGSGTSGQRP